MGWGKQTKSLILTLCLLVCVLAHDNLSARSPIPRDSQQMIIGIARDWNDSHVKIYRFEHDSQGWVQVSEPWPGRLGSAGLAWGRGLHPSNLPGLQKREGDKRAPAGVFTLGGAYGDISSRELIRSPALPYHQVTPACLWIEDPASPYYNTYQRARDPNALTPWEKKQQMKQNDPAHEIKLLINHNTRSPIIPGAGSSIFFHIWRRGGAVAAAGCTVFSRENMLELIAWVDPQKNPVYVLLPASEYRSRQRAWALPQIPGI